MFMDRLTFPYSTFLTTPEHVNISGIRTVPVRVLGNPDAGLLLPGYVS
jgi:hypothetical protein